ncbi:tyrosine-type recombinase/integrase [Chitinophaga nivalis]|uniref:Tyrosine-type recombinase/integrase n=1 Tax=Chitinophaga nivalis TaxID=2991709 RepID=A0ABT3IIG2_9BACT|nr:tyrosine-type recombinase/integrase [Chitinophaga nivalis]MCW3466551.1 tyrosine-type recombinase/integrase [Chitinophaga nivalis]MCW3483758.1 tyrosine-type recombinase/integrase [Chitinophaga nivalis]
MFTWSNGYVYFSFYCDDARCRTSIGIQISKDNYTKGKIPSIATIKMSRIKSAVDEHINICTALKKKILKNDIKSIVDVILDRKDIVTSTFLDDWDSMIEQMKTGELLIRRTKKRYKPGTIDRYTDNKVRIKQFSSDKKVKLEYECIDKQWIEKWFSWSVAQKYSQNTICLITAQLRFFLSITFDRGIHENAIFKSALLYQSQEEVDAVALTEEEIKKIYDLNLKGAKARARDIFVFGCYVGLRVDDLNKINNYHLVGDHFEFFTDKSSKKVTIPLHWIAASIYHKYKGKLPVYGSRSSLRPHLSDLCSRAGISEQILIVCTKGGVTEGNYYAKHDLVSSHTMRRSFATNAVLAGIPDRQIMLVTGHTTTESFNRYVKISDEQTLQLLKSQAWFKVPQQTLVSEIDDK